MATKIAKKKTAPTSNALAKRRKKMMLEKNVSDAAKTRETPDVDNPVQELHAPEYDSADDAQMDTDTDIDTDIESQGDSSMTGGAKQNQA